MKLVDYKLKRQKMIEGEPQFRHLCPVCIQPEFSCYCHEVKQFDPKIKFVILIHPIEVRRRIATGRMAHLCLKNSLLISGQDYSQNAQVNNLIQDPNNQCLILYPGPKSVNLSLLAAEERSEIFKSEKQTVIFVIDGTWATARKMVRLSQNLHQLPRIGFSPVKPSNFRVRKQPKPECYSTIEAIHYLIELIQAPSNQPRMHDRLLHVFNHMVERQLEFIKKAETHPNDNRYRRDRHRKAEKIKSDSNKLISG